ncbi:hypothetical protein FRB94_007036 [Tulasnella sp. JGI-2019a]|nr:hypothetical protein FRB94_007036 [Tulasnella sp. JGI-2019a]
MFLDTLLCFQSLESEGVDSLVFLDQTTLLLPRREGLPPRALSLDVYKFSRLPLSDKRHPGATCIGSFGFPEIRDNPGTAIIRSLARCEPALSYRTTPGQRSSILKSPEKAFRSSQSSRIITLSFSTDTNGQELLREYTVIISAESIREMAMDLNSTESVVGPWIKVPWAAWGPKATRWFDAGPFAGLKTKQDLLIMLNTSR